MFEVGQLPLGHKAVGQPRILTVEPDHAEALGVGFGLFLPSQSPDEHSKRPDQKRNYSQDNRCENNEKRRQQSESGTWTDIGSSRHRNKQTHNGN
jgi:hypothetical protein